MFYGVIKDKLNVVDHAREEHCAVPVGEDVAEGAVYYEVEVDLLIFVGAGGTRAGKNDDGGTLYTLSVDGESCKVAHLSAEYVFAQIVLAVGSRDERLQPNSSKRLVMPNSSARVPFTSPSYEAEN